MCVCVWTLIIFQAELSYCLTLPHVNFVFFLKNFFFWCTSTQITLKFFHVSHVSHVSAMLNFMSVDMLD